MTGGLFLLAGLGALLDASTFFAAPAVLAAGFFLVPPTFRLIRGKNRWLDRHPTIGRVVVCCGALFAAVCDLPGTS